MKISRRIEFDFRQRQRPPGARISHDKGACISIRRPNQASLLVAQISRSDVFYIVQLGGDSFTTYQRMQFSEDLRKEFNHPETLRDLWALYVEAFDLGDETDWTPMMFFDDDWCFKRLI